MSYSDLHRQKVESSEEGRLMDREGYLRFLEGRLETVSDMALTATSDLKEEVSQIVLEQKNTEERISNLAKAVKLTQSYSEEEVKNSERATRRLRDALRKDVSLLGGKFDETENEMQKLRASVEELKSFHSVNEELRLSSEASAKAREKLKCELQRTIDTKILNAGVSMAKNQSTIGLEQRLEKMQEQLDLFQRKTEFQEKELQELRPLLLSLPARKSQFSLENAQFEKRIVEAAAARARKESAAIVEDCMQASLRSTMAESLEAIVDRRLELRTSTIAARAKREATEVTEALLPDRIQEEIVKAMDAEAPIVLRRLFLSGAAEDVIKAAVDKVERRLQLEFAEMKKKQDREKDVEKQFIEDSLRLLESRIAEAEKRLEDEIQKTQLQNENRLKKVEETVQKDRTHLSEMNEWRMKLQEEMDADEKFVSGVFEVVKDVQKVAQVAFDRTDQMVEQMNHLNSNVEESDKKFESIENYINSTKQNGDLQIETIHETLLRQEEKIKETVARINSNAVDEGKKREELHNMVEQSMVKLHKTVQENSDTKMKLEALLHQTTIATTQFRDLVSKTATLEKSLADAKKEQNEQYNSRKDRIETRAAAMLMQMERSKLKPLEQRIKTLEESAGNLQMNRVSDSSAVTNIKDVTSNISSRCDDISSRLKRLECKISDFDNVEKTHTKRIETRLEPIQLQFSQLEKIKKEISALRKTTMGKENLEENRRYIESFQTRLQKTEKMLNDVQMTQETKVSLLAQSTKNLVARVEGNEMFLLAMGERDRQRIKKSEVLDLRKRIARNEKSLREIEKNLTFHRFSVAEEDEAFEKVDLVLQEAENFTNQEKKENEKKKKEEVNPTWRRK